MKSSSFTQPKNSFIENLCNNEMLTFVCFVIVLFYLNNKEIILNSAELIDEHTQYWRFGLNYMHPPVWFLWE